MKSGTFHPPRIRHKGTRYQIFNFKTPAKSETSSSTQPQLGLDYLEISPQMGHALLQEEIRNCISKSEKCK